MLLGIGPTALIFISQYSQADWVVLIHDLLSERGPQQVVGSVGRSGITLLLLPPIEFRSNLIQYSSGEACIFSSIMVSRASRLGRACFAGIPVTRGGWQVDGHATLLNCPGPPSDGGIDSIKRARPRLLFPISRSGGSRDTQSGERQAMRWGRVMQPGGKRSSLRMCSS